MVRNNKYLEFLRTLPCIYCGENYKDVCGAHIRKGTDGGMGMKPSDYYALPLCQICHERQHAVGEVTFWRNIEYYKNLAKRIYEAYLEKDYKRIKWMMRKKA